MQGGVVFRAGDAVCFLPATVAIKVLPVPEIERVPGGPPDLLGVALVDGDVVPVLTIGHARTAMLVCSYLGENVGLVGMDVLAAGRLDAAPKQFDIAPVIARVRENRWPAV